eukprot:m.176461 g.176461  ORF g.176461 m.176461 type:complete len:293 (-) comp31847_c15_seq1:104-982(-)
MNKMENRPFNQSLEFEEVDLNHDRNCFVNVFARALQDDEVDEFFNAGEKLYDEVRASGIIKDRRYHLKTYKQCFRGNEMVTWMLENSYASSRSEAVAIGSSLILHGIYHHVTDDHNFKDTGMFYRFREDDKTYRGDVERYRQTAVEAVRLHGVIRATYPTLIAKRDWNLLTFNDCFVGSKLIDWLVETGRAVSREHGIETMKRMWAFGFIAHVANDHLFKDEHLYYRFYADKINSDASFLKMANDEQCLVHDSTLFSSPDEFVSLAMADDTDILNDNLLDNHATPTVVEDAD